MSGQGYDEEGEVDEALLDRMVAEMEGSTGLLDFGDQLDSGEGSAASDVEELLAELERDVEQLALPAGEQGQAAQE